MEVTNSLLPAPKTQKGEPLAVILPIARPYMTNIASNGPCCNFNDNYAK
jgi:hypothetical protein